MTRPRGQSYAIIEIDEGHGVMGRRRLVSYPVVTGKRGLSHAEHQDRHKDAYDQPCGYRLPMVVRFLV